MKVQFTDPAKEALDEVYERLRRKGLAKTGRRTRAKIILKAMALKDFPYLGQEEENLEQFGKGHRYLVEGNYKIIYRIDDPIVFVTDIFDTRQDPGKMKD